MTSCLGRFHRDPRVTFPYTGLRLPTALAVGGLSCWLPCDLTGRHSECGVFWRQSGKALQAGQLVVLSLIPPGWIIYSLFLPLI